MKSSLLIKYLFVGLLIYAIPAFILWGLTFSSDSIPANITANITNSDVTLTIFLFTTFVMSPFFIVFGGISTIVLGILYYVASYGALFYFFRRSKKIEQMTIFPNNNPSN
jgi:hypothetical protein